MKDRTPLRSEFEALANKAEADKQYQSRTVQLEALQTLIIKGFNNLIGFLDGKVSKTEVVNQLKEISTPDVEKVVKALEKVDKTIVGKDIDLKPILVALKGLKDEVSGIPSNMPKPEKQKDSVKVENLEEIVFDTAPLEKAIKELKLDVKVGAPVINTEKVELKPLQDIMLDLLKAFNKQKFEFPKEFKVSNLKDVPLADLSKVEDKLDQSNKHLKVISEKKSGGGGGGESTLDFPLYADLDTDIATVGEVTTITITDGEKTRTVTMDNTDPDVMSMESVWS